MTTTEELLLEVLQLKKRVEELERIKPTIITIQPVPYVIPYQPYRYTWCSTGEPTTNDNMSATTKSEGKHV